MLYYKRLKDIREDRDIGQKEIASVLETTQSAVSDFEAGKNMMRMDKYIKLAKYYNLSLDYLTGITDTPKPLWEEISEEDIALIRAFHKNKKHREAVKKLLDMDN